jgi:hypothetical protein
MDMPTSPVNITEIPPTRGMTNRVDTICEENEVYESEYSTLRKSEYNSPEKNKLNSSDCSIKTPILFSHGISRKDSEEI